MYLSLDEMNSAMKDFSKRCRYSLFRLATTGYLSPISKSQNKAIASCFSDCERSSAISQSKRYRNRSVL